MKVIKMLELAPLMRQGWVVMLCVAATLPVSLSNAQEPQPQATGTSVAAADETAQSAVKIPSEQLDSLVAPIALYPDPLLAQVLAASTYPLELIQLNQWLEKNPELDDQALADAAMEQPWDPSVQAMSALPDVVEWLADDIQWTTDLGNAFLSQQSDVMEAIQRMRKIAQEKGTLESGEQVEVKTEVVESKEVIIIQQSNPEIIYVPSYDPVIVYGPPRYPYPPIYYPPPAYYGGAFIAFGVGVAIGAAWGGGWGWGCGWGGNNIHIDINNNFNRHNINHRNHNGNRGGNNSTWRHDSAHRGGTPYSDRATAEKFGGNARGDSLSNRQSTARNRVSQQGGNLGSANRATTGDRAASRASAPANRNIGANRGTSTDRSGMANRSGAANRSSGANRVGNRDMSRPSGSSSRSAMGSGNRSGGYSGPKTRASANRGSSSLHSRGGSRLRR